MHRSFYIVPVFSYEFVPLTFFTGTDALKAAELCIRKSSKLIRCLS